MSTLAENSLDLAPHWQEIKETLRQELGEIDYHQWILSLEIAGLEDGELHLYVPTRFYRDQMQKKQFSEKILHLWRQFIPELERIDYKVQESAGAGSIKPSQFATSSFDGTRSVTRDTPSLSAAASKKRKKISSSLNSNFTFDSFVVGKPNEFAYACARRVAESPSSQGFNPLFFYGGVGLGKTHLMHAIGAELLASGEHSVAYMSAEQFLEQFMSALQESRTDRNALQTLKDQWRSFDVFMIDDVQFFLGKQRTQEEFFNTFNYLMEHGSQIVLSADKSPSDLPDLDARLRSRLGSGMVADLHAANYDLRYSIVRSKAEASGVNVPEKVLHYLASKITSSVRELEGAFNRILSHSELLKQPITLESTQELLKDLLRAHEKRVTVDEIKKEVAEHWNIRVSEMTSSRRTLVVARPRQVAMYLSKELTEKSLPDIGREFKRDHTTVMHSIAVIGKLIITDPTFAASVETVRRRLET